MRILMAQEKPCIRDHKESVALDALGYEIHLACHHNHLESLYGIPLSEQVYESEIILQTPDELLDLAGWFDLVHCHNESDSFAAVMTVSDTPSIHDCHDLMSVRGLGYNRVEEGIANKYSDARVYVSRYQQKRAHAEYGLGDDVKSVVFNSSVLERDLPRKRKKKLSRKSGELHFVYEGGLNANPDTHRYMIDTFRALVEGGAWVHVYGFIHDEDRVQYQQQIDNPRLVFHNTLPPGELLYEMTQYDYGLAVFNVTKGNLHHLNSTLPNKLYEYLSAGLPVICSPLTELMQFVALNVCGIIWTNTEEVLKLAREGRGVFKIPRGEYTVEKNIGTLTCLYERLVPEPSKRVRMLFPKLDWEEVEEQLCLRFTPGKDSKMVKRSLVGLAPCEMTERVESLVANRALEDL